MANKITLQQLAKALAQKKNIPQRNAESFLKEFFDSIAQNVSADKLVKIKGLGTFKLIEVLDRESVNVNTGERIVIPGHSKLSFTPETALKDLLLTSKLLPSTKERALRRWNECQKQLRPLSLLQEEIQTLMNRSLRLLLSRFKHSRLFLSPNKRQLLNLLPSLSPSLSLFLSKKTNRPLHQKRRKVVAFGLGYWGFCCFACSHF